MGTTQRPQVIEKDEARMQGVSQKSVNVVNQMQRCMQKKSQEIEHQENRRQIALSMAKIVLHMVPFAFQDIDAFVLKLPARAAKVTHIGHIAG